MAAAVAVWRLARRAFGAGGGAGERTAGQRRPAGRGAGGGVLAPLAILTADVHRGESVATFLFPPLLWLALFGVISLAGLHREGVAGPGPRPAGPPWPPSCWSRPATPSSPATASGRG